MDRERFAVRHLAFEHVGRRPEPGSELKQVQPRARDAGCEPDEERKARETEQRSEEGTPAPERPSLGRDHSRVIFVVL